jgi:hypothetical protein
MTVIAIRMKKSGAAGFFCALIYGLSAGSRPLRDLQSPAAGTLRLASKGIVTGFFSGP